MATYSGKRTKKPDKRDRWIQDGPDDLAKRLKPYWNRVTGLLPDRRIVRIEDEEALLFLAGALHDSELGLDEEADSAMANARGRARKEFAERMREYRITIQQRTERLAEQAAERKSSKKAEIENYV